MLIIPLTIALVLATLWIEDRVSVDADNIFTRAAFRESLLKFR